MVLEELVGGRLRSCRMIEFLSGPECSPSCDGASRLRSAAAAAASSLSLSCCLLGRPTGFLGLPGPGGRPGPAWRAGGGAGATIWLPLPLEFSDWLMAVEWEAICRRVSLPGPWEEGLRDGVVLWLPVLTLECREEEKDEEGEEEEMLFTEGLWDWRSDA